MTERTECTRQRKLLGVYVLGAIEPAERAVLDAHLNTCGVCRDELASLAGLPALLSRVTEEQIEQLAPPPRELFDSIVAKAGRESRTRRRRNIVVLAAAAAALVIATGAGVDAITGGEHHSPPTAAVSESPEPLPTGRTINATDPVTGVQARVTLLPKQWGTEVLFRITGAPPGTHCRAFVVDRNGATDQVSSWQVAYDRPTTVGGSTMMPSDRIGTIDVRTLDGKRLIALPV
jgi:hypothetical protein